MSISREGLDMNISEINNFLSQRELELLDQCDLIAATLICRESRLYEGRLPDFIRDEIVFDALNYVPGAGDAFWHKLALVGEILKGFDENIQ